MSGLFCCRNGHDHFLSWPSTRLGLISQHGVRPASEGRPYKETANSTTCVKEFVGRKISRGGGSEGQRQLAEAAQIQLAGAEIGQLLDE